MGHSFDIVFIGRQVTEPLRTGVRMERPPRDPAAATPEPPADAGATPGARGERRLRLVPPLQRERPRRPPMVSGLVLAMLVIGLIPWIGVLVSGAWDQTELGIGLLLCVGAGWAMLDERRPRGR